MRLNTINRTLGSTLAAGSLGLVLALAAPGPTKASSLQVGVLNCIAGPSIGVIVATPASLNCTFYPSVGALQNYKGVVIKVGLGIGISAGTAISWVVYAQQADYAPQGLAGTYAGLSAEAAFGLGVGVNSLLGGSNQSVMLTPISVQGQVGLGFGIGVTEISLVRA